MLPSFVIIGAMKAGTTSLFQYLNRHPAVFMPGAKELNFFIEERNWARGLAWYEDQFADADQGMMAGEASPGYSARTMYPGVPERIAATLPDARLVYVVREPLDRMRSHYQHEHRKGRERRPIDVALREEPRYLDASRYAFQLDAYLEHFPREQIMVVQSEQLRHDRVGSLARLYGFLGVDSVAEIGASTDDEYNRTDVQRARGKLFWAVARTPAYQAVSRRLPGTLKDRILQQVTRPVDPTGAAISLELVHDLRETLVPDVQRLRSFLGSNFDGWGIG